MYAYEPILFKPAELTYLLILIKCFGKCELSAIQDILYKINEIEYIFLMDISIFKNCFIYLIFIIIVTEILGAY